VRVAIIGTRGYPYVYSGYETFLRELVERLVKKNVKVTVYCHRNLFKEKPKNVNGVDLVYIPTIETKSLSQLVHSFFSMTHACLTGVDVIFVVNSANGPFGLISRLFKIPTAINVDGLEWLRPKWKGFGGKYFKWASKQATRWYDIIINDADEMRRIYQETFDKDSVVIAYGGNIRYSKEPALIKEWDLKPKEYYLIVGRFIPDNNWGIMIEGFMKSNSKRKLVVVGDVPYENDYSSNLKKLSEVDERLVFTGLVTNRNAVAELFHNAYVYMHGHEFGGTNPTMLEALSFGSAIIALDTAFNREVLSNEKYGLYFQKNESSVENLIAEIDTKSDLVTEMKSVSRNGITKKYNWDHITDQYIEVFEKLKKAFS
jgi:glycosyltransferase involved in cell wall biosynthesis